MPRADADILIDTHVLLWWQARSRKLSQRARSSIDAAHHVFVSPISFWEVSMLVVKGRVELDRPTQTWVTDFLASSKAALAELTPETAVAAGQLEDFHGDPADRIIYSTAAAFGVRLISKDRRLRDFDGTVRVLW